MGDTQFGTVFVETRGSYVQDYVGIILILVHPRQTEVLWCSPENGQLLTAENQEDYSIDQEIVF